MNRSAARGTIYSTLAGCYGPPDERRCRWIAEGSWIAPMRQAFGVLNDDPAAAPQDWEALVLESGEGGALETMRECRRLFVEPLPDRAAAADGLGPAQGIAPGRGVFPRGGATMVSAGGAASPLVPREEIGAIPGRVVAGFEFMGMLADREALLAGAEKIRFEEVQLEFFSRFLLPWAPLFCERIVRGVSRPFYRGLGDLTGRFLQFEKNYLAVSEEGDGG